jgi:hypothetical protein
MEIIKLKNNLLGEYIKEKIEEAIKEVKENPELLKKFNLEEDWHEIKVELINN